MSKRSGAGAILLPKGVFSIEDVPADLANAIDHGMRILSWQENLTDEEMPPRWMWHLDWELVTWFEEIDAVRKAKYGTISDDREEVPLEQNSDPEARAAIAERFGR